MISKKKWDSLPIMTYKLTLYKEDDEGNQKYYEPHQDYDYSSLCESFSNNDLVEIKEASNEKKN